VGYDGELLLFEDPTLPTNKIEAKMTEKPPKSPIFGSYGLTVTFQTCHTPSPSSLPSMLPSSTPSSTPSDTPSLQPSNAPSNEPSSAPSGGPSSLPSVSPTSTCPISEFTGRSFFLPLLNACFKMEIFDGGNIYVDEYDSDCTNPKFDTSNPMSYYGGTEDGNKATFVTNGKPGKWSGELFVVQGDTDSIELSNLNIGQKRFQVLQKMSKCVAAPSMSPSILPTDLPSYSSIPSKFPTRDPSTSPSSKPSLKPSELPSNIHSSLPSQHPTTLHPNACPSDGFLGRTFKSVVYDQCWIFETYPGGKIKIDPTDSTCNKMTPDSSTYALSQYKQSISNRFIFERIPGATGSLWEGYIQVIEDVMLTQENLELTKLGWTTNKFAFMLKVPVCPSSTPSISSESSVIPSSKPSSRPSIKPSTVPSLSPSSNPLQIGGFGYNTCVKRPDKVFCWGDNSNSQLADQTTINSPTPKEFPSYPFEIRSSGYYTCMIGDDKKVQCWGYNYHGQLGLGDTTNRNQPAPVELVGDVDAFAIATADKHTCIIGSDKKVQCWGNNDNGQLGLGDTTNRNKPSLVELVGDVDAFAIAAADRHTCAIGRDKKVQCWGRNNAGQLGLGDTTQRNKPSLVELDGDVDTIVIATGGEHTCAIGSDKKVQCWGANNSGQLGLGNFAHRNKPSRVELDGDVDASAIVLGQYHTCIVGSDKKVQCWGYNYHGQLGSGNNSNHNKPFRVKLDGTIDTIAAGMAHTCVIDSNSYMWCWGHNSKGQLGIGNTINRNKPAKVHI
jgi:alpha-tubulin suppressor-like RCC1 family protein